MFTSDRLVTIGLRKHSQFFVKTIIAATTRLYVSWNGADYRSNRPHGCRDNRLGRLRVRTRLQKNHALLPQSPQYLPRPRNARSQTGHLRTNPTPVAARRPDLTSSISNTMMIVIAVPVKYSLQICRAQPIAPASSSQFTTSQMLPRRRMPPTKEITTSFLVPKLNVLSGYAFLTEHSADSASAQAEKRLIFDRVPQVARGIAVNAEEKVGRCEKRTAVRSQYSVAVQGPGSKEFRGVLADSVRPAQPRLALRRDKRPPSQAK